MAAPRSTTSRRARNAPTLLLALLVLLAVGFVAASPAPADLQSKLDAKEAKLGEAKDKQGVLTSEVTRLNEQVDQLTGEVAALRNREAVVQEELDGA